MALPFLIGVGFTGMDASMMMMEKHRVETGLTQAGAFLAKSDDPSAVEAAAKKLALKSAAGGTSGKSWAETDVVISYRDVANTTTNGSSPYRGGQTIRIIEVSTSYTYKGLGLISSITSGGITISASYEERLTGNPA